MIIGIPEDMSLITLYSVQQKYPVQFYSSTDPEQQTCHHHTNSDIHMFLLKFIYIPSIRPKRIIRNIKTQVGSHPAEPVIHEGGARARSQKPSPTSNLFSWLDPTYGGGGLVHIPSQSYYARARAKSLQSKQVHHKPLANHHCTFWFCLI